MTKQELQARNFTLDEYGKVIDDMGNEWRNENGEIEYIK